MVCSSAKKCSSPNALLRVLFAKFLTWFGSNACRYTGDGTRLKIVDLHAVGMWFRVIALKSKILNKRCAPTCEVGQCRIVMLAVPASLSLAAGVPSPSASCSFCRWWTSSTASWRRRSCAGFWLVSSDSPLENTQENDITNQNELLGHRGASRVPKKRLFRCVSGAMSSFEIFST